MKFSAVRAGVNLSLFAGLVGVLLGPYVLLLTLAPRKRHHIAKLFFRGCSALTGLRLNISGKVGDGVVLFAANHASYLDIPVLGATIDGGVFVAKSEVAKWPLFGFLARISRTVFISRNSTDAAQQRALLAGRMNKGSSLILFPEGTSTDGSHTRPFKSTLFAALDDVKRDAWVQPVSIIYARHRGGELMSQAARENYTWFGEMTLAPHLLNVFGAKGCEIDIMFHEPLNAGDFSDRKQLARSCEEAVSNQLIETLSSDESAAQAPPKPAEQSDDAIAFPTLMEPSPHVSAE